MRYPWCLFFITILGCTDADGRCRKITGQAVTERLTADVQQRVFREIDDSLNRERRRLFRGGQRPSVEWVDSTLTAIRKRVTARLYAEAKGPMPEGTSGDSAFWNEEAALDSTRTIAAAPPRPSEIAWASENCFEGRAR